MVGLATEISERKLNLSNESATVRLAGQLAQMAHAGDVIALSGGLGAGKTRLARAFIGALMDEAEEVPSPTFTLVQTYESLAGSIWHFDLYRVDRPDEVFELGFEEALAEGISLIEWPERLRGMLPADRLEIALDLDPTNDQARIARLTGRGNWAKRLMDMRFDG
jgi:tRNA threonylcarbamoyladenosine biosynthesis protein TsaE